MNDKLPPIHPGEVLLEDFLLPLGVSQYRLAKDIAVPPRRVNEIVHGIRGISADTALRLARYFGTSPELWMNLQSRYDLERQRDEAEARILGEVHVLKRNAA
ncbi:MAG: addiction module antidote protein, HigA family [Myxococcales bacterium]|nr:addiction module antidote protein, HigA family [Myxococcales bacterium]